MSKNRVVWGSYGHSRSLEVAPIDRARMSSYLNLPHLYLAPPLAATPLEFRLDYWHQKTRVSGLSYGIVCVILQSAVLIQYWCVTDRRTPDDSIYCASIVSHGKKPVINELYTGLTVDSYLLPTSKSRDTKNRTKIKNRPL